jgi:hypothetical protein
MVKDPKTKMKVRTEPKDNSETIKKITEAREKRKQERLYKMKAQGLIK